MKRLLEKDLQKFSIISGISVLDLQKLLSMKCLNDSVIIDHLVRYDFRRLKRCKRYTVRQLSKAIGTEYQISKTKVQNAIYGRRIRESICPQCGKVVRKQELNVNHGICDSCAIKSIEV